MGQDGGSSEPHTLCFRCDPEVGEEDIMKESLPPGILSSSLAQSGMGRVEPSGTGGFCTTSLSLEAGNGGGGEMPQGRFLGARS